MNLKSKFSWGHIIAFVALILISYGTFLGAAYSANGKLLKAGIIVLLIDVVLIFFMIAPQLLKGASKKDAARLRPIEKTLIYISPVVFVAAIMLPFSPFAHFTKVLQHKEKIEQNFSSSIASADALFTKYEDYSKDRFAKYNNQIMLADSTDKAKVTSHTDALNLLLQAPKYKQLKTDAQNWMTTSCAGASIWNVFIIGNIGEIQNAIVGWHDYLVGCSKKSLSTEVDVVAFDADNTAIESCKAQMEEVKGLFGEGGWSIIGIIVGILLYGMMLLPYLLQERDSGLFEEQCANISNDNFII